MIEINLVPDVKQELIRAERVRWMVITGAMITGLIAVGAVVGLIVFAGIQKGLDSHRNGVIERESAKLSKVEDLESSLTIQNQLALLPALHDNKKLNSRIFDVLTTINPTAPNNITISKSTINTEDRTIEIEAQAAGGYSALEVFKKTIAATEFVYTDENETQVSQPLAVSISDGERSYGENEERALVLRFSLTFEYPEQLFLPYLKDARIVGPNRTNVTDSNLTIPRSLFSPKANDTEGER